MSKEYLDIEKFSIVGINNWEATVDVRERFSLSRPQVEELIHGAKREGIKSLFAVSTCNRTEIFAQDATTQELIRLLIAYSDAALDEFHNYGFENKGKQAVDYILQVAVRLDSQIQIGRAH